MAWFLTFGRYSATGIPQIDCGLQVIGVGRVFPGMGLRFFVLSSLTRICLPTMPVTHFPSGRVMNMLAIHHFVCYYPN